MPVGLTAVAKFLPLTQVRALLRHGGDVRGGD